MNYPEFPDGCRVWWGLPITPDSWYGSPVAERDLQKLVASYLDNLGVLWCHVPNESKRTPQYGAMLRAQGLKSGVPDVLIFAPRLGFNGLAIELKIGKNRPTKKQAQWLGALTRCGWLCQICRDIGQVHDVVSSYLG